jgi:hypothetical protein
VAVAATKCLTESADVYAATPLWQQLRSALDAKLAGATLSRVLGGHQLLQHKINLHLTSTNVRCCSAGMNIRTCARKPDSGPVLLEHVAAIFGTFPTF